METTDIKIDKIHNISITYSIDKVSYRASKHKGKAEGIIYSLYQEVYHKEYRGKGNHDEEPAAKAFERPERRPCVPEAHDMEKGKNLDGVIERQIIDDEIFCYLVKQDNRCYDK